MTDFIIHAHVIGLEEKQRLQRSWRDAQDEVHTLYEPLGWFILFEGSHEWLYVGRDKPLGVHIGDQFQITFTNKGSIVCPP